MTVRFSDLRAKLYTDQTWTTGNATLHLINTTTLAWSPDVDGNNTLIITNSDLADFQHSSGNANIFISDSTVTLVKGNDAAHLTLVRCALSGDVVATGNSVIELTDTVAGRIVREGNGVVILHSVRTTGRGFVLDTAGAITTRPEEVISGSASVRGSNFGTGLFNGYLHTDPGVIPLAPNQTYRITCRYRIITTASRGFEVLFISQNATAAGNVLPSITINGAAGDSGVATLTNTLGPYPDYRAAWNATGTGAIVIDDIQIVNVATGQVVASENAETLATAP